MKLSICPSFSCQPYGLSRFLRSAQNFQRFGNKSRRHLTAHMQKLKAPECTHYKHGSKQGITGIKVGAVSTSCAVEFHWKIICVFVPMSRKEMIKYNQLVQTRQSAGKWCPELEWERNPKSTSWIFYNSHVINNCYLQHMTSNCRNGSLGSWQLFCLRYVKEEYSANELWWPATRKKKREK